jgi:hypothetical protein
MIRRPGAAAGDAITLAAGRAGGVAGVPPRDFAVVLRGAATFGAGVVVVSGLVTAGFLAAAGFRATLRFFAVPFGAAVVVAAVVGPAFFDGRFRGGREGSVGACGTGSGGTAADGGTAS